MRGQRGDSECFECQPPEADHVTRPCGEGGEILVIGLGLVKTS